MFDARGQRVGVTVHILDGSGASGIAYWHDDDPNGLWLRSGIEQPLAPRRQPSTQGKSASRGHEADELSVSIVEGHAATAVMESKAGSRRAELRVWYAGLWPKLALAARERRVSSSQALALDRAMRDLLDVRRGRGVL
jgi:hypothetical protein